jgi:nitronate monooxygenase
VATRFTVTEECGLPADVKQEYFKASEDDIEVNQISPTGYPMRMIKSSPASATASARTARPTATCSMPTASAPTSPPTTAKWQPIPKRARFGDGQDLSVHPHAQLRYLDLRPADLSLKDTTNRLADGSYQVPSAEHIFKDYQFSTDQKVALPEA